jgi:hypothetical protein
MASERRQLNVRLDPESADRFDRVSRSVVAAVGVEMSQAQIVALALKALEDRYPAGPAPGKSRKKTQEPS